MRDSLKKVTIIILSFVLCITNVGLTFAEDEDKNITEEGLTYTIENEEVTITGYEAYKGTLIIPSHIKGYPVTAIGDEAFYSRKSTSIYDLTIPDTVKTIGKYAFYNQSNFTYVKMSSNVESIGEAAFSGCSRLDNIQLPETLKEIPDFCFFKIGCKKIILPDSIEVIGTRAFAACDKIEYIKLPKKLKTIKDGAFAANKKSSYNMEIPEGMETIEKEVFRGNDALRSISIPSTVKTIQKETFSGCSNLNEVKLSEGIETINSRAFEDATTLKEINFPDSLTYIGEKAFYDCISLKNISIPKGIKEIQGDTFYHCKSVESITFTNELEKIGRNAFNDCTSLTNLELKEGLKLIDSYAFSNCTSLKKVSFPSTVYGTGVYAFSGCTSLEKAELKEGIKSISVDSFEDCTNLKEINLPKTIAYINDGAFYNCKSLKEIEVPEGVTSLGKSTFAYCLNLEKIVIPKSVIKIYSREEKYTTFKWCTNLTIYGHKNTIAEEIAKNDYINFVPFIEIGEGSVTKIADQEYTGSCIKPKTTIEYDGNILKESVDYTVSYSDNKNIGKGSITYKGIGKYTGTKTVRFNIIPQKSKNPKVSNISTTYLTLKWDKVTGVDGYYIYKIQEGSIKETVVKAAKTTSCQVEKLKSGTKYSFKVVPYKKVDEIMYKNFNSPKVSTITKLSKTTNLSLISPSKGCAHVTWKYVNNTTNYELKMSKSKKGTYSTIKNIKGIDNTVCDKYGLSRGKTYYFKIRAYRTVNGKKIYGDYSDIKSIKIK